MKIGNQVRTVRVEPLKSPVPRKDSRPTVSVKRQPSKQSRVKSPV
jgi:hypothetical protein